VLALAITRRKFVTRSLALGAGVALTQLHAPALVQAARTAAAADKPHAEGPQPSVLYDLTQCTGCHLCEVACQVNKGLPPEKALLTFRGPAPSSAPKVPWVIRRQQCMHCLEPACASVCPVGAMVKTPEGPVIYEDKKCFGCRFCMNACPFNVPAFDWDSGLLDQALIRKCDFCADRQAEGKRPACVEACPAQAVVFGTRDEMIAEAHRRITANPDRYVDHVYGEHEAGGTSFIVLSNVPFEDLGMPLPGGKPPQVLSEKVMAGMEWFIPSWLAVLVGVTGLTKFRQRRMNEIAGKQAQPGKEH
jgi:formate dehydrogenase iron-sulfur subunit